jgi:hypothetical protein
LILCSPVRLPAVADLRADRPLTLLCLARLLRAIRAGKAKLARARFELIGDDLCGPGTPDEPDQMLGCNVMLISIHHLIAEDALLMTGEADIVGPHAEQRQLEWIS